MLAKQRVELLGALKARFENNLNRDKGLDWAKVQVRLGELDRKTSSWIATPADFREQGGALWCGRSSGSVFIG